MPDPDHNHHGDEFGKAPAITGVVGPGTADAAGMLGPSVIQLDGIVENDSGKTPPPPPTTPQRLILFFGGVFVAGLFLLWVLFTWMLPWADAYLAHLQQY